MSSIYEAVAPDGTAFKKQSTRAITYGIAHLSSTPNGEAWVINSFCYGARATAEKRMNSLKRFYKGQWAIVEAKQLSNG